jgi:hypothetical protein
MSSTRNTRLRAALAVAASLYWAAPGRAADHADEASRVEALLVIDTLDKNIGAAVKKDRDLMKRMLEEGFPKEHRDRLRLKVIDGADLTPTAVLRYYEELPADPNATLFFYYSGHGAADRQKGHYMNLREGAGKGLLRSQLLARMQEKRPRLIVLITDCCSVFQPIRPSRAADTLKPEWETMRCLLLQHHGVVNVNACDEGELAWTGEEASLFTLPLAEAFCKKVSELDRNRDGFAHWQEVFPKIQERTQDEYARMRNEHLALAKRGATQLDKDMQKQISQTALAYSLPPQWRFGVRVEGEGEDGVRIAEVFGYTPAAVAGLLAGDVIQQIGDRPVKSGKDIADFLASAKGEVRVKYRRVKKEDLAKVFLAPWQSAKKEVE